ncbi:hypothetical protein [Haloarchaeobius sp. HME9146]|uniref:hypothetical protein n=1 Tax=Haloarchaeobius sp. HME9146 TaxID=2978732 RepID=UPI0021BF0F61|nr:hypothetical protein [Haloarchaeobius sp. HME9146]MCT9094551.1 hypothetical protein [Haloarchaeobius sp. HME9146]
MSSSALSRAAVLAAFESLGPPGTPVSIGTLTAELGCSESMLSDVLEELVAAGELRTKTVASGEQLWWCLPDGDEYERLREREAHYRTLFESMDEGYCLVEVLFDGNEQPVDYRFLETNPAFDDQTGLLDAEGKRMRELEPRHEEHWFEIYGHIALTGESIRFTDEAKYLGDRCVRRVCVPYRGPGREPGRDSVQRHQRTEGG